MKRKLKLTLSIDYDKLMKEKKIDVKSGYSSSEEEDAISKFVNEIAESLENVESIDMVIEDFGKWESEGFRISNKMGSCSSRSWSGFVRPTKEEKTGEQDE